MTKLDEIMTAKGLKNVDLARAVGAAPPEISRLRSGPKNGGRKMTPEWAKKLAPKLGCGWKTLLEDPDDSTPLVSSFDPDAPPEILDPDAPTVRQQFPKDAMIELDPKAGMGEGQVAEVVYRRDGDEITTSDAIKDDYWRFPPSFVRYSLSTTTDRMIVIECNGDSMEPTLRSGERVWVDTAHVRPTPDGLYAIRDQLGGIVVKRLELDPIKPKVRIISDNPLHPPREVAFNEIAIIGKVKCSLRMF
jgi:hypothetical protein